LPFEFCFEPLLPLGVSGVPKCLVIFHLVFDHGVKDHCDLVGGCHGGTFGAQLGFHSAQVVAKWGRAVTREKAAKRKRVQEKLVCSVGDRPTKVIVRGLVAWIAERREIEFLMPIDKAIFRMVSKSSGRNESERRFGLERRKLQRKPSSLP